MANPNTVYWIGSDNNVYAKGAGYNGVQNIGTAKAGPNPGSVGATLNGKTTYYHSGDFIADPNPGAGTGGGGASSGGGGGSAAASSPDYTQEAQYWADQQSQLDQQIARLTQQQQVGQQSILDSYNSGYNTLTNQQTQANRDLGQSKQDTINDNVSAKNSIDDQVRGNLTGLQALLASRGAGGSGAYSTVVPYVAATQGNQQRNQVQSAYVTNLRNEDEAQQDSDAKYVGAFGDLLSQKTNKENSLKATLANTQAGLQQQKADAALQAAQARGGNYASARAAEAPFLSAVNTLLNQAAGLGGQTSFTPQKVDYTAPNLSAYTYDPTATPTAGSGVNPGQASNVGAYWSLVADPNKKQTTGTPAVTTATS